MYVNLKTNTEDTTGIVESLERAVKEKDEKIYNLTRKVVRLEFEIEDHLGRCMQLDGKVECHRQEIESHSSIFKEQRNKMRGLETRNEKL